MEEEWYLWLQMRYRSPYTYHTDEDGEKEDGGSCTIAGWARALIYDSIIPRLSDKGYVFCKYRKDLLNAFLNYLFRVDGTPSGFYSGYTGRPPHTVTCTRDDMDFYITHKCPIDFWAHLRKEHAIERFADDSIFADRLWADLPWFIFYQINYDDSPATEELIELLEFEDGEDNEDYNTVARRSDIDPYLMEYGKKRNKGGGGGSGGGGGGGGGGNDAGESYSDQAL
jgi:uncharacterized membrane protein YgcG